MNPRQPKTTQGPVWDWFGLTYSSYLVMPRRALCSMPLDWQEKFVALMNEANELLPEEAVASNYMVRAREGGKFINDPNIPYKHARPWQLKDESPNESSEVQHGKP